MIHDNYVGMSSRMSTYRIRRVAAAGALADPPRYETPLNMAQITLTRNIT